MKSYDVDPDWEEIEAAITEAWRTVAPKRVVAVHDANE